MLMWALGIFIAAMFAAAAGFTDAFKSIAPMARVLFFILMAVFLMMFLPAIL